MRCQDEVDYEMDYEVNASICGWYSHIPSTDNPSVVVFYAICFMVKHTDSIRYFGSQSADPGLFRIKSHIKRIVHQGYPIL